jgi:hypothetical protein
VVLFDTPAVTLVIANDDGGGVRIKSDDAKQSQNGFLDASWVFELGFEDGFEQARRSSPPKKDIRRERHKVTQVAPISYCPLCCRGGKLLTDAFLRFALAPTKAQEARFPP